MQTQKIGIALIVLMIFTGFSAFPQDKLIKSGDSYFKNLQYRLAIKDYQKAWNKMKKETFKKRRVEQKLGDCYRIINQPEKAAEWYGKIVDTKVAEKAPAIYLYYADIQRELGNCKSATTYYKKYLQKFPDNVLAKNGLLSCELFSGSAKHSRYIVKNEETLNSIFDDYAATYSSKKQNQLFFTSDRKGSSGKDQDNWTGAWFSDIYLSNYKNDAWENPVSADETKVLNTGANEGTPVFNKKFTTLYFTRCDKGADKKVYCQIMKSDRRGQRWTRPRTVISERLANVGQPWISPDELTIYFVSNQKGGQGGKDIWMAKRSHKSKSFGEPVNLGPVINTPGDEMFPYLQGDTILYFASNGHPGLGGLDLFMSIKQDTVWSKAENLLPPLNSTGDDFAIVFKNEKEGFFSSNRNGGSGGDDIYHFLKKRVLFDLDGIVKDERTFLTLPGVTVLLINTDNDTLKKITGDNGSFSFDTTSFEEDKSYRLILSKKDYFTVSKEISTYDYVDNQHFNFNVRLTPIPEEPILLPDILYEYNKWDLKPQYQDSLMVLVKILNDNPNLVIELGSHTDSRASDAFNDVLSQKRAQTVVDFLISQDIDPERLIAKGYGERVPRKLDKDYYFKGYTFKKGTVLTDRFINSLGSDELKEAAHKLNRRTEFKIVSKNYKPAKKPVPAAPVVQIVSDTAGTVIPYTLTGQNQRMINCYLNDFLCKAVVDDNNSNSSIGDEKIISLMKQGALSKEDFEGNIEMIMKNNQIKDGSVVIIKNFRIGDKTLDNVRLTIHKGMSDNILIGKNVLNEFGTYTINDLKKQIIFK